MPNGGKYCKAGKNASKVNKENGQNGGRDLLHIRN